MTNSSIQILFEKLKLLAKKWEVRYPNQNAKITFIQNKYVLEWTNKKLKLYFKNSTRSRKGGFTTVTKKLQLVFDEKSIDHRLISQELLENLGPQLICLHEKISRSVPEKLLTILDSLIKK